MCRNRSHTHIKATMYPVISIPQDRGSFLSMIDLRMRMLPLWNLVFLAGFFFTSNNFSEAHSDQKKLPSAVVIGTVYCETCFHQDFSKSSHFISGATVAVECKDSTNSRPSFRELVKTNEHGEFKVHLPFSVSKHVKKIKGCTVKLISSSEPFCAVASTATSSLIRLKSRKQGTHIFSAGFFTFKPLKQPEVCDQKPSIKKPNTVKSSISDPNDPTFFPPIRDPPPSDQPPLGLPPLPNLPNLPNLPALPPLLPGVPYTPPVSTEAPSNELSNKQAVQRRPSTFFPFPPVPFLPPPSILPPNPFQPPPSIIPPILPSPPPSIFPPIFPSPPPAPVFPPLFPSPPSPPPSIFPPLIPSPGSPPGFHFPPLLPGLTPPPPPTPPPSIFPPLIPSPGSPPGFHFPPLLPGLTPSPPPPPPPSFPIPFPFPRVPGFPGVPPASRTKKNHP